MSLGIVDRKDLPQRDLERLKLLGLVDALKWPVTPLGQQRHDRLPKNAINLQRDKGPRLRGADDRKHPARDCAITVVREAGRPEVRLAFEQEADAQKLANAMKADAITSYSGWASQRVFELDGTTPRRWRPLFRRRDGIIRKLNGALIPFQTRWHDFLVPGGPSVCSKWTTTKCARARWAWNRRHGSRNMREA